MFHFYCRKIKARMYIKALPVAALLGKLYTNGLFSIINIYYGDPSGFFLLNA